MIIKRFDDDFSVCKVSDLSEIDFSDRFCFLGKTDNELSVVCHTEKAPDNAISRDDDWKMFRLEGTLEFSLVGILADISAILAQNKISIFAVSTYKTDYILTKAQNFEKALECLAANEYKIVR